MFYFFAQCYTNVINALFYLGVALAVTKCTGDYYNCKNLIFDSKYLTHNRIIKLHLGASCAWLT